jgi:hypothetical protein
VPPRFFDRATNTPIPEKLDSLFQRHIEYLQKQIDRLLEKGVSVLLITVAPVDGWLPWTHFDANNALVWELEYRCDYSVGLKQQVDAERSPVDQYRAGGKNVYLVDTWQIFKKHRGMDGTNVDIMHPGSAATDLIAEEWIRVFAQAGALVRRRRQPTIDHRP